MPLRLSPTLDHTNLLAFDLDQTHRGTPAPVAPPDHDRCHPTPEAPAGLSSSAIAARSRSVVTSRWKASAQ
ncbi:hypothetical protein GCM10010422_31200 [Streptomyces graminearus]|uniref:Uncharacterized protein n=1 Tax=Streptomyces graminearus TaxID=284030 RepID=A0ABN3LGG1_9ACTN